MSNSNIEGPAALRGKGTYSNPVFPEYFADPFVWSHDGIFYAVGTGPEETEAQTDVIAREGIFPILRSRDLIHWEPIGRAMRKPEFGAAFGTSFWAPEVAYQDGKFFLYYSVGRGDQGHHLRVAISSDPAGPYHDSGSPLTDPADWLFAIDPHPFRDEDGTWTLFFAADFLDAGAPGAGSVRAGTGLVAQPLETMTRLAPGRSRVILRARHDWQRFQADRPLYGGRYDWHTLEGPCVTKHAGRYYCLYSAGRWESDGYGVDYGVADHILGPYSDLGAEGGPRVLKTIPGRVLGPGHNSLVTIPGGAQFLAYHAWDERMTARRLCLDPLLWTRDGPRSPGPTWVERPAPMSGFYKSGPEP